MIVKIHKLANFGNYRQFEWENNASFSKFNLIYGWNYSGKTTLSRFFQTLAEPSSLLKWKGCQFDVELTNGVRLTDSNNTNPPLIKVFNRDFIQSNFQQEHKAPAVFIVGDDTIQMHSRIILLENRETKLISIKGKLNDTSQRLQKEIESLGRSHASFVATLIGDKTYNRTKLLAEVRQIKSAADTFVMADNALDSKVSLLRSTYDWGDIKPVLNAITNLDTLRQELSLVLQKTASNEAIAKLKENRDLEAWIRTGLMHHHDLSSCLFCGSEIPAERITALQKHFSKAYEDLSTEVALQLSILTETNFDIELPDQRDFMPDLKDHFLALRDEFSEWIFWAKKIVEELIQLAQQKQVSLETKLNCNLDTKRANEADRIILDINALIIAHNEKRSQIEDEKNCAKVAIEKHHAAVFYLMNDVAKKEDEIETLVKKVCKVEELLRKTVVKKNRIETQIQQKSFAAQKINETLRILLPENIITVSEVSGGFLEFQRDGTQAYNLSDGEKTAITFAYFLATLESNGASLNNTIVFIDDPISSLDSNHIYAIYALITKRLNAAEQIFVSTHNSELYTLLKECWFKADKQYVNKKDACSYYIERRIDGNGLGGATLRDTPPLLRKYKSEYQFVFDQLHKFSISQNPTLHEAFTSPNLLRKFLEAYLGFQKPCISRWGNKLDLLFDNVVEQEEIQKFADDASHMQSLNHLLAHPQFVSSAQANVKKVMSALKAKNPQYYKSMCTVIGADPEQ